MPVIVENVLFVLSPRALRPVSRVSPEFVGTAFRGRPLQPKNATRSFVVADLQVGSWVTLPFVAAIFRGGPHHRHITRASVNGLLLGGDDKLAFRLFHAGAAPPG
jgi:hypothetical protein